MANISIDSVNQEANNALIGVKISEVKFSETCSVCENVTLPKIFSYTVYHIAGNFCGVLNFVLFMGQVAQKLMPMKISYHVYTARDHGSFQCLHGLLTAHLKAQFCKACLAL